MTGNRDLQALVDFSGDKVLSVYLDTDLGNKSKDAVKLMFRERAKALKDSASDEIQAVQKFLDYEYDWQFRGLALFVTDGALWKVLPLPIPVRTQVFYANRPYVRILTDVLDRFGKYGVALIDKESVRLFSVTQGNIQSETEAFGEELKRHKQGGWAAARYQRHEDNLALLNLKQAVEGIRIFAQKTNLKRLMLGGSPEVLAQVKQLLPKPLAAQIIGEFAIDMEASPNDILDRSLDIATQVDWDEEQEIVAEAITAAAKGQAGVTGLTDTLYQLHQGRVRLLLIEESFKAPGYICANCGYMAAERFKECPFCKHTEINDASDAINIAIHKALETGADVNIVRENDALNQVGGIAAILRY
jgi:peptide chain release factor subunit 1